MASGGAQEHQAARVRPAIGETIIGIGVLALAIVMAWQALSMPVSPIYAQVGPTIVPIITALALGMLGILLLVDAVQGGWQPAEEKEVTPDRAALLWIVAGLVRLRDQGASVDALMAVTFGTWAVYGSYLVLRYEAGWHGRRAAYLALVGFAFVVVARLGLQVGHFS